MTSPELMVSGNRLNIQTGTIAPSTLVIRDGRISDIHDEIADSGQGFLIPGFVDAHIHIESSMLMPSQFAKAAAIHGTVATVSDPHEIANVCGREGIKLMLDDAAGVGFKFHFGAPSCVPATQFETSGAELGATAIGHLLDDPRIGYLSEMMNYPGVLAAAPEVVAKISAARKRGKPVDGHAPGLRGDALRKYFSAGITTDHECTSREEAIEKLSVGCKIAIREGSAARNFDALQSLISEYPHEIMFCSDDKHPDELLLGHINQLVARAISGGHELMNVIRASSINAIEHYGLDVGMLRVGDRADFIRVRDLQSFQVIETFIDGQVVARDGESLFPEFAPKSINQFGAQPIDSAALDVVASSNQIRIIEAFDGQLITGSAVVPAHIVDGKVSADPANDILKIVVVNRYQDSEPAVGFVRGFGIRNGAIASSVAHDSHNVVAVGSSDLDLSHAINAVISHRGGLSVATPDAVEVLPLPVAGLMSTERCEVVGETYRLLDRQAKQLGSQLRAPFMTLSFMALLVIPSLKLSDQGLFDVDRFQFTSLFVNH